MEGYNVYQDYLKLVDVVTEKDDSKKYPEASRTGLVREGMEYQKTVSSSKSSKRESEDRRRELSSIPAGIDRIRPASLSTDRYLPPRHVQDSADVRTEIHGRVISSDIAVDKLCDLMEKQVLSTKPKRRCASPMTLRYVQPMDEYPQLVKKGHGNFSFPNVPTSVRRMPFYAVKQPQPLGFLPFSVSLEPKLTQAKQVRSESVPPWPKYTSVLTETTSAVTGTTSVLTGNNTSVITGNASMVTENSLLPIRETNAVVITSLGNERFSNTYCQFCKKNGETSHFYKSHALKDSAGKVRCPVLRSFRCPICNSTGDEAHTITYCPFGSGQASMMTATRTPRKSCGCPREKNMKRKCHHHDPMF